MLLKNKRAGGAGAHMHELRHLEIMVVAVIRQDSRTMAKDDDQFFDVPSRNVIEK